MCLSICDCRKMWLSENLSVGKFVHRKIWPSENVVVRKFAVGKVAVGKTVSENLLSENPPDTASLTWFPAHNEIVFFSCQVEWNVRLHRQFSFCFIHSRFFGYSQNMEGCWFLDHDPSNFAMNQKRFSLCAVHHVVEFNLLFIFRNSRCWFVINSKTSL